MSPNSRSHKLSGCAVFFDFDNTITTSDVLDDLIKTFSIDGKWRTFEKLWRKGAISSKECLQEQLKSVRLTQRDLIKYLAKVKIDPYTHRLFDFLKKSGVRPVILSDSFLPIIKAICKSNGIAGTKVYANSMVFKKNRPLPSFPYLDGCRQCAHCKKEHLLAADIKDKTKIYIGDGLSDICAARVADLVFAKEDLLKYLKKNKKPYIAFKNFKDIYHYLKDLD